MAGLRIGYDHAIQQNHCMIERSSAYANVGLHPVRTALADVYRCDVFQQILKGLHRRRSNFFLLDNRDHTGNLRKQYTAFLTKDPYFFNIVYAC